MALADAVAALPGGGEFAALWSQVDGDPGAIGDLAGTLQATASKTADGQRCVGRAADEVGAAWRGDAANAFTGYVQRFDAAASSVRGGVERAATALQQVATSVSGARDQVDAIAGRILDQADRADYLNRDPDTAGEYDAVVARLVSEGCAEARPIVQRLVGELQAAAGAVHAALSEPGFLDLKAADDSTYLPTPGKPIRWTPILKGAPSTAPASAGSGGSSGSGSSGAGGSTTTTSGPVSGGPPAALPTGNVATWISEATKILEANGVPADKLSAADINTIIEHESSGNPHAENLTDSNAAAGHPSKGLMQTIDSTFDSYSLPGHKDIWNPVDNIIAGVRYALSRYGSLDSVPGVAAVHSGGSYVGY